LDSKIYRIMAWTFDRRITWVNLLMVAILVYFSALSIDDVILARLPRTSRPMTSPIGPARDAPRNHVRSYYEPIISRDLFNLSPAPEPVTEVIPNLHITLIGTSRLANDFSFIVVEDNNDHKQFLYGLGSEIPGAGKLISVEKDRAVIEASGKRTTIEMPKEFHKSSLGAYPTSPGDSSPGARSPWHIPQFHTDHK
jgi:Type II secretion system protein C